LDALRRMVGIFEGGDVFYRVGIEDGDVGIEAGLQQTTLVQPNDLCGQGRELPDCVLHGEHVQFAYIHAEDAREAAIAARMSFSFRQWSGGADLAEVGADTIPRLLQSEANIRLAHT